MVVLGFFGAGQCFVSPKFKYSLLLFKILGRRAMFALVALTLAPA